MLRYRLTLEPDDNGTILVTSPDLPIATYGEDQPSALSNADDAIKAILASMMDAREDVAIPEFQPVVGDMVLTVALRTELKVQLYRAMRAAGLTRADLQRRLGWQRESVDRLFRLDHRSRLDQLEEAFRALGKVLTLDVRDVSIDDAAGQAAA